MTWVVIYSKDSQMVHWKKLPIIHIIVDFSRSNNKLAGGNQSGSVYLIFHDMTEYSIMGRHVGMRGVHNECQIWSLRSETTPGHHSDTEDTYLHLTGSYSILHKEPGLLYSSTSTHYSMISQKHDFVCGSETSSYLLLFIFIDEYTIKIVITTLSNHNSVLGER
mgnify:CR=1 FL=1